MVGLTSILPKTRLALHVLSALDPSSEASVQETLNDLQNENVYTTLIIGHVFSNIQRADKIVVLSAGGSIADEGTHSEVSTYYVVACIWMDGTFVPSIDQSINQSINLTSISRI